MLVGKKALRGEPAKFSIIDWKSKATSRVCRSTFAGVAMSASDALESALYLRGLLVSLREGRLVKEAEARLHMQIHMVTDCKSLYAHVHREGAPKAPRAAQ